MKFSLSFFAALAATALAQATTADFDSVTKPEPNQKITAGKPFEIVWSTIDKYAAGTVSIHLIGGETQNTQQPLADIAAGIPNSAGKYTWAVDASLGAAKVYGLVFRYEKDPSIFQYSNPFHIVKAAGPDTTTTVSKSYGEKTVTLSSCSSTSIVTPPPVVTPTTTPCANSTMSYVKPTTIKTLPAQTTSVVVVPPPQPTKPSTVPVQGAGARFGASSVALVGAFVVAAFAL